MNEKQAVTYIRCHFKYYQRQKNDDLRIAILVFFAIAAFGIVI